MSIDRPTLCLRALQVHTLPELRGVAGLLGLLHRQEKRLAAESLLRKQVLYCSFRAGMFSPCA